MSTSSRPRSGRSGADPARPKRGWVLGITAATVLALDLVSKIVVVATLRGEPPVKLPGGYLWLTHARNPGAAFSFAEGATVVFTAVAVVVVVVIIRTASKLRSIPWALALGGVLGGAAGNLVDRLFRSPGPLRGHVVDWISLRTPEGERLFPIFNLADSGIVCGGILAVLLALLGREMDGTRAGAEQDREPAEPAGSAEPVRPPDPPRDGLAPSTGPAGSAPGGEPRP